MYLYTHALRPRGLFLPDRDLESVGVEDGVPRSKESTSIKSAVVETGGEEGAIELVGGCPPVKKTTACSAIMYV
jgi:hypothetical protein